MAPPTPTLQPERSPPSYDDARQAEVRAHLKKVEAFPGTWVAIRYPEVGYARTGSLASAKLIPAWYSTRILVWLPALLASDPHFQLPLGHWKILTLFH